MAYGDPCDIKYAGTRTASAAGVMALSEFFVYLFVFAPLVAGDNKASLASLSPYFCPFRHLEGSLA